MESVVRLLYALVPPVWTVVTAAYLLVFLRTEERAERWAPRLAGIAAALHVAALVAVSAATAWQPPVASAGGLLFAMALATALVYLVLETRIGRKAIGVFPMALVTIVVTLGSASGDPLVPVAEELRQWGVAVHVGGAILGYAGLLLAAMFGALYLLQRRALRGRKFGLLWDRLPSLELLDQMCFRSLLAAFLFQTLTIGCGHWARFSAEEVLPYASSKIIVSNGIWLLAGVFGVGRAFERVRPRVVAVGAVGIFCIALATVHLVARGAF